MKLKDILKPKSEEEIIPLMDTLSPDDLLIQSSEAGFLIGVKKALKMGADVHAKDDYALQMASFDGHLPVVKLLLKNGADVSRYNYYALRWATTNGHHDVVELLKEYKAYEPLM